MTKRSAFLDTHSGANIFWGVVVVICGLLLFVVFMFAAVISKLLPSFENKLLSSIQNDRYYYLLVPLTLPVLIMAVYFHWLSMKLFKHA